MSGDTNSPCPRAYRNRIEFIDSFICVQPFIRLLDIGAGGLSGNVPESCRPMARYIANTVGPDRYLALELDSSKAERVQKRFGVPNVRVGGLTTFWPASPVDVAFEALVFVAVRRIDDALDNIRRNLRSGGWLLLDHSNLYSWRNLIFAVRQGRLRPDQDANHCFDATWQPGRENLLNMDFSFKRWPIWSECATRVSCQRGSGNSLGSWQ